MLSVYFIAPLAPDKMPAFPKLLVFASLCVDFQFIFISADRNRNGIVSSLIRDVLDNEDKHSCFWMKSCWPKFETLKLLRSTNRSYVLLQNPIRSDVAWDEYQRYYHNVWFGVDMNCEESIQFLANTNKMYFRHPFRWILIDGNSDIFEHLHLLPDNNVIWAQFDMARNRYSLVQGKDSLCKKVLFGPVLVELVDLFKLMKNPGNFSIVLMCIVMSFLLILQIPPLVREGFAIATFCFI